MDGEKLKIKKVVVVDVVEFLRFHNKRWFGNIGIQFLA